MFQEIPMTTQSRPFQTSQIETAYYDPIAKEVVLFLAGPDDAAHPDIRQDMVPVWRFILGSEIPSGSPLIKSEAVEPLFSTGMFNIYVQSARQSLESGDTFLAEQSIERASVYARTPEALAVLEELKADRRRSPVSRAFEFFSKKSGAEAAIRICFYTLQQLGAEAAFQTFAETSMQECRSSYPELVEELKGAWLEVGIKVS
jgi:hypothetical protein